MENRAYALITGIFLIGIVAAILAAAQWMGGERHVRVPYRVVSTQPVSGLSPQAAVRYRGMGAGRVTSISLDPKDARRILVDVEVDSIIPITRGTYAQLGMEGITGVAYVHLLDDGKDLAPAAPAPSGRVELDLRPSFMDSLSDNADVVARDARELIANLNKLLAEENRANIGKTLASLERVAASLEETSSKLPGAVQRADARLNAWLDEDNRKLARQTLERLNETAAAMPALAREAQRLAEDSRALVQHVSRLSVEAQGTTATFRDGLPQVNALVESVDRGAQRVGRLAAELDRKPDSLLWGRPAPRPGPGEPGFE